MYRRSLSFRLCPQTAPRQRRVAKGRSIEWRRRAAEPKLDTLVDAGPKTEKPDHTVFEQSPLNRFLMDTFRRSLAEAAGGDDSPLAGFDGIMDLSHRLNDSRLNTSAQTKEKAARVLRSLFPVWFTTAITLCISRPFPEISARLNAWTTSVTCTWLMGAMEVNDIELDNGETGHAQGVLVERCRFLEASNCASICHNSCKLPTQKFFKEEMGLDVTLEPNYEDFSCQFYFGKKPPPESEDPVLQTPCFLQCPTKKRFAPTCSKTTLSV